MAVAIETPTESFADLHARLGGVPLSRIRLKPAPGTATEEDLLRARKPVCELVDGVLVEKAVGTAESLLAGYILRLLWVHVEPDDLGVVLGADGHLRLAPGQVRAPDVSFVPWSSFPNGELPEDEAYWSVAPTLAIEVLSYTNTAAEIERKLGELFTAGCKLIWIIDPRTKTAKVYTSLKRFKELDETGVLDGGKVLPGFKLPLADLFAVGKPRKKKPR
ncbi:MAG: Uma2 family endonuclease [Planctomycetes bacterium]|nr:Uma2 family endonuclease [Planctomycetota bacterium]